LIEEEDHVTLRSSLEQYDQYDAIKLAKRLEKHELLEFRRIAALLYRVSQVFCLCPKLALLFTSRHTRTRDKGPWATIIQGAADSQLNHMYEESLALSKADRLWRDALETAASSKDVSVAEELAGYFVSIGNKDAFAAILYVCFELVRPDFVEEMVSLSLFFSVSRSGKKADNQSWRFGLGDYSKPYELQLKRDQATRVSTWSLRDYGVGRH
jgi:clathrin heavy chain